MELIWNEIQNSLIEHFEKLYPTKAKRCIARLNMMIGRYSVGGEFVPQVQKWSEKDVLLITYADMIKGSNQTSLRQLRKFAEKHLYEK